MGEEFALMQGMKQIGSVWLYREGLYCRIVCRCTLEGAAMQHLQVCSDSGSLDLGTLVPAEGGFGLDMRLSARRLGAGQLRFFVEQPTKKENGSFSPIRPEEPFSYIERLKTSFLTIQNGEKGIFV